MKELFWVGVCVFWMRVALMTPSIFAAVWRRRLHGAQVLEVYTWNCALIYHPPTGIKRYVTLSIRASGPSDG